MHEIRWNPLIKQWVIVAEHRSMRPWRPEESSRAFFCPFCPGAPELAHLEKWDVVVLPNRYPALVENPEEPSKQRFEAYSVMAARGVCRVVVETPQHEGDLHNLSLEHLTKVVETYRSEFVELSQKPFIEYVAVFRNKGKEIGVSLTHPHAQIYALPFVPPRIQVELSSFKEYLERTGKCLLCDIVEYELKENMRVVYENELFVALLPYYAMWPYEIHVYPKKHVRSIAELSYEDLRQLADVLRVVTATYSVLLERDAPYIMVFHNPPMKGDDPYHFHVEFYQPYRDKDKLKYAAGIEWGFWVFTYDGSPERKAEELREACRKSTKSLGDVLGSCR